MAAQIAQGIEVDPSVHFGKPVIAGMRVPRDLVLPKLAGGMTYDEVSEGCAITPDDIRAALGYAATVLSTERVRALI